MLGWHAGTEAAVKDSTVKGISCRGGIMLQYSKFRAIVVSAKSELYKRCIIK